MNLVDQLRRDEGEVLHAYQDSLGYWTIGCGRMIDARKSGGITLEESAHMLQNDIDRTTAKLEKNLSWFAGLDQVRKDALVNMGFNLGVGNLLKFNQTLAYMEQGNYDAAATEMLNSAWALQVGARAQRLSIQIRTGVYT
jgi:lysozyme